MVALVSMCSMCILNLTVVDNKKTQQNIKYLFVVTKGFKWQTQLFRREIVLTLNLRVRDKRFSTVYLNK